MRAVLQWGNIHEQSFISRTSMFLKEKYGKNTLQGRNLTLIKTALSAEIGIQRQWNKTCSRGKEKKQECVSVHFPLLCHYIYKKKLKCLSLFLNSLGQAGREERDFKREALCRADVPSVLQIPVYWPGWGHGISLQCQTQPRHERWQ